VEGCFFCGPDKDRVLYTSEHFYVLLGLGPIVEGYAILVARQHVRSMFDLPEELRDAYTAEKRQLKDLIARVYGPSIVTEHGRVLACTVEDEEAHDLLCYHAHQLFFPVDIDLSQLSNEGPFERIEFLGNSLFDIDSSQLQDDEEYLLFENSADQVFVHKVRGKCPRQYMRYLVARSQGQPELASWQRYPDLSRIKEAKRKYMDALLSTPASPVLQERNYKQLQAVQR
jgi:ATP adenylyltransferase